MVPILAAWVSSHACPNWAQTDHLPFSGGVAGDDFYAIEYYNHCTCLVSGHFRHTFCYSFLLPILQREGRNDLREVQSPLRTLVTVAWAEAASCSVVTWHIVCWVSSTSLSLRLGLWVLPVAGFTGVVSPLWARADADDASAAGGSSCPLPILPPPLWPFRLAGR